MKPTARLLTPRGRGAVGTIRVDARAENLTALDGFFLAVNGKAVGVQDVGRVVFGHWGQEPFREEVVVCRVAPNALEIHCHGGDVCTRRILSDLESAGLTQDAHSEFAPLAEVRLALQRAPTLRTAAILLKQERLWRSQLDAFRNMNCESIADTVAQSLAHEAFGFHLTQAWQVVIAGPPNAGKSTLLNALLGFERSIVFDQPGTTRDVVSVQSVVDGWPVVFSDTAGLREASADAIERAGINAAERLLQSADLTLVISDLSAPATFQSAMISESSIRVGNKADVGRCGEISVDVEVSALTGDGIGSLLKAVAGALVPDIPPDDICLPVSSRHTDWLRRVADSCEAGDIEALRKLTTPADPRADRR